MEFHFWSPVISSGAFGRNYSKSAKAKYCSTSDSVGLRSRFWSFDPTFPDGDQVKFQSAGSVRMQLQYCKMHVEYCWPRRGRIGTIWASHKTNSKLKEPENLFCIRLSHVHTYGVFQNFLILVESKFSQEVSDRKNSDSHSLQRILPPEMEVSLAYIFLGGWHEQWRSVNPGFGIFLATGWPNFTPVPLGSCCVISLKTALYSSGTLLSGHLVMVHP